MGGATGAAAAEAAAEAGGGEAPGRVAANRPLSRERNAWRSARPRSVDGKMQPPLPETLTPPGASRSHGRRGEKEIGRHQRQPYGGTEGTARRRRSFARAANQLLLLPAAKTDDQGVLEAVDARPKEIERRRRRRRRQPW